MDKRTQSAVYVNMLVDALDKKEKILDSIYTLTKQQGKLLLNDDLDEERFMQILDEKGRLIQDLNTVDDGFDTLFKLVKSELQENQAQYREKIQQMQKQIAKVSELGVRIQALEHQNSGHFKTYLSRQRKAIREFHVNKKTASRYYQNMANTHKPQQSYFFNETK